MLVCSIAALLAGTASVAYGASQQTFVASYGIDAENPSCLLANRCLELGRRRHIDLRDSTLSLILGTGLKTSGTGSVIAASLVRSTLHNANVAVDHGQGRIYLDQTNITRNIDSLVNNGSGDVKSAGNNFITDNIDATPGTTYITSFTTVTLK